MDQITRRHQGGACRARVGRRGRRDGAEPGVDHRLDVRGRPPQARSRRHLSTARPRPGGPASSVGSPARSAGHGTPRSSAGSPRPPARAGGGAAAAASRSTTSRTTSDIACRLPPAARGGSRPAHRRRRRHHLRRFRRSCPRCSAFRPGQHLTLRTRRRRRGPPPHLLGLRERPVRPAPGRCEAARRRRRLELARGRASAGDVLEVLPPAGRFGPQLDRRCRPHLRADRRG